MIFTNSRARQTPLKVSKVLALYFAKSKCGWYRGITYFCPDFRKEIGTFYCFKINDKLGFMGLFVHFLPASAENEPKERRLGRRGVGRMKDYAIHSLSSILSSLRTLLTSPKCISMGKLSPASPLNLPNYQCNDVGWVRQSINTGWLSRLKIRLRIFNVTSI